MDFVILNNVALNPLEKFTNIQHFTERLVSRM